MQSAGDTIEKTRKSSAKSSNIGGSFLQLNDAADEFFDFPNESELDNPEDRWHSDASIHSQESVPARVSTTSVFVKKLHDLAVGCIDLQESPTGKTVQFRYGDTLPKDPSFNIPCSWANGDPSAFLIRGESYLQDNQKIKGNSTLMQIVAADWIQSDKTEDDLGGRQGSIVQRYAIQGSSKFFFIVNIQIPGGANRYSLALYYMMDTPLEDVPLLNSFVRGDDAYRNSRFKLIPYISKGSWIVKQSVGKKACLLGPGLEIHYFGGTNYLEANTQGANTPSTPKSFIPSVERDNIVGKQCTLYGWARRLIAHGLIQFTDPNLLIHGKIVGSGNFKIALTEVVDSTCQLWLPDGFHESISEVGVGGFVVWPEHSIEVLNG